MASPLKFVKNGSHQFERGELAEAISTFKRVNRESEGTPFHSKSLYWLGVLHYKSGRKEELMKNWNALLDGHPDSIWARKAAFIRSA